MLNSTKHAVPTFKNVRTFRYRICNSFEILCINFFSAQMSFCPSSITLDSRTRNIIFPFSLFRLVFCVFDCHVTLLYSNRHWLLVLHFLKLIIQLSDIRRCIFCTHSDMQTARRPAFMYFSPGSHRSDPVLPFWALLSNIPVYHPFLVETFESTLSQTFCEGQKSP